MTAQPYIVTHSDDKMGAAYGSESATFYREAFATLDGAQRAVRGLWLTNGGRILDRSDLDIPPSGGLTWLPDGSVIEVEPTTYGMLAAEAGFVADDRDVTHAEIRAAWNAKHGIAAGEATR
jgi:hypothetical protein